MKLRIGLVLLATIFAVFAAVPARADVVITPFVGSLFGGDLPNGKADYGVTATFMGGGIVGGEVLFNYAPSFVPKTLTSPSVAQAGLMGNLIIGIPIGGDSGGSVRPYVTGGVGLFRTTAKQSDFFDRVTSNDMAFNVGGGVMGFFSDHVGIRGDLRYVRTIRDSEAGSGVDFDLGELNFLRGSIGAAFRF
jgi:hypothetical protein